MTQPGPQERRAALGLLVHSAAPDAPLLRGAVLWLVLAAALEALGPVLGKAFIDRHLLPRQADLGAIAGLCIDGVPITQLSDEAFHQAVGIGVCRAWGVEAKFGPSEDSFGFAALRERRICRPIAVAMGQKAGEKWTAAAKLQPTFPSPTNS